MEHSSKKSGRFNRLNTGAGKTIIGLLIAQSLVNEGIENVIYVCATIDLVLQTAIEAKKIGLQHTTRIDRQFDNELFESGKAFCITTYHALFNGHSVLRKRHFPGAVVFDDAHVSESILRDAVSIRIDAGKDQKLFRDIASLFVDHFQKVERTGEFRDSLGAEQRSIVMASPGAIRSCASQLSSLIDAAIRRSARL